MNDHSDKKSLSELATQCYNKPYLEGLKFYGYKDRNTACFSDPSGNDLFIDRMDLQALEAAALLCPINGLFLKVYPITASAPYKDPINKSVVIWDKTELLLSARDVSLMLDGMNARLEPSYDYNM